MKSGKMPRLGSDGFSERGCRTKTGSNATEIKTEAEKTENGNRKEAETADNKNGSRNGGYKKRSRKRITKKKPKGKKQKRSQKEKNKKEAKRKKTKKKPKGKKTKKEAETPKNENVNRADRKRKKILPALQLMKDPFEFPFPERHHRNPDLMFSRIDVSCLRHTEPSGQDRRCRSRRRGPDHIFRHSRRRR